MKTKKKCKTKHDPQARHMLERHLANSGPMTPQQTRAMWAKKNNPAAASASSAPPPRTFIPVPRVPVPGIPQPLPATGTGTATDQPLTRPPPQPVPPPDPMQEILDKISRLRQGLPQDPNAAPLQPITVPRGGKVPVEPHSPAPAPTPPPPKTNIIFSTQPGNGIWKGKTPDPALKKKGKGRGTINNRFAVALHFLEQHGAVP